MLKRIFALFLSLMLLLSALPYVALATESTAETQPVPTETTVPADVETTVPADVETTVPAETEQPGEEIPEEEPKKLEVTANEVPAWGKTTPPQKLRTKAARIQLLQDAILWDYQNAQVEEDAESLLGYCGLLASYQLYYRGINNWRKSADGKNNFDEYSSMKMTSGGYVPQAYASLDEEQRMKLQELELEKTQETAQDQPQQDSAPEQENTPVQEMPKGKSLKQVLDTITDHGTHDVYNVLVCFEKTSTQAGSVYGHVVFVYGIIDGVMYFTEGGDGFGVKAGEPMKCTIAQFAASYDTWAEFEGVVVFGCKDYLDNCAVYQSDMFGACVVPTAITSLPCEEEESAQLRAVSKGERLHVIGLYRNREEVFYYQIDDGGEIGYVPAASLRPILYLHDTFTLTDSKVPENLKPGKDFRIGGTIHSPGALLRRVCVQILDEDGKCIQKVMQDVQGESYDLANYKLNSGLEFHKLEEGSYTCRIQADSLVCLYVDGKQINQVDTQVLLEQAFTVGDVQPEPRAVDPTEAVAEATDESQTVAVSTRGTDAVAVATSTPETEPVIAVEDETKTGWYYENDTWYCYKQGAPRSGWVRSAGVVYYLNDDGSVTTGEAIVEGQARQFTATGAMRTGWSKTTGGTRYLNSDGLPVIGWSRIDGTYYYFDEQGFLQDKYTGQALRQLRQMGLTLTDIKNANENIPQEE